MIRLLLLGPSGAGKSTLSQMLAPDLKSRHLDLDQHLQQQRPQQLLAETLRRQGPQAFYQSSCQALQTLHAKPVSYLADIGAGTQWSAQGQTHFLQLAPSLCLWAEPRWLWLRNQQLRQDPRSLTAFQETEYSPWRQQLYRSCTYWLDGTHKTPQELLHSVQQLLADWV
ncbi:MAG: hypothetical protein IGS03_10120 [Candidatus Sericytochromatia bacterium]|nr:hypothetical protein [Candidatus Sericytochromatia bacterium]